MTLKLDRLSASFWVVDDGTRGRIHQLSSSGPVSSIWLNAKPQMNHAPPKTRPLSLLW